MSTLLERGAAKLDMEYDLSDADLNAHVCDECHMLIAAESCPDCEGE